MTDSRVRRLWRNNSLSIVLLSLFLVIWLCGQAAAGMQTYNAEQRANGAAEANFAEYLTTAHFGEATFENWESEFFQMSMYIMLTVWLRQKGSAESKKPDGTEPVDEDPSAHADDPDAPGPVRRGGLALALYKNSLTLAFLGMFLLAFLFHAWTGSRQYNGEQEVNGSPDRVGLWTYLARWQFWFESLQNWQSEFLAVAAIVLLSIVLRQQGSPESKAVHAPHSQTGSA